MADSVSVPVLNGAHCLIERVLLPSLEWLSRLKDPKYDWVLLSDLPLGLCWPHLMYVVL